jgi:uncharacterized HAD superfamily protein/adenine/guanine phosphoribosyltransferase-like PRPP-binding protein
MHMYGYMSFGQLATLLRTQMHRVPASVDLIVGIPRSGMIPAYMLGLYLNRQVTDLQTFIDNGVLKHGQTRVLAVGVQKPHDAQHVLLVDDSIASGGSIVAARDRIEQAGYSGHVTTCAAVTTPSKEHAVDISFASLPLPRLFEWNAFHHACVENACFDLDGVLCVDPTESVNDDGKRYREFVRNAKPLHLPTHRIGHIVSARLEKYRALTEAWLEEHGIRYGQLHLIDLPTKEERTRLRAHAPHKVSIYRKTGAALFFESERSQAHDIANGSGKPVLCIDGMQMILPNSLRVNVAAKKALWRLRQPLGRVKGWVKQQVRA